MGRPACPISFNATGGGSEVYDLAKDKAEKNNLVGEQTSQKLIQEGQQHLAAWVQYQKKLYDGWLAK